MTPVPGPGQWWQNLRLPYYAMLAEGGADIFRPLLQFYKGLLPLAKRRTEIWFNKTDSAGRDLAGKAVHGAFFMETMTQFGTYVPSEKGYHCSAVRPPSWTVDWAGNEAINLHREGTIATTFKPQFPLSALDRAASQFIQQLRCQPSQRTLLKADQPGARAFWDVAWRSQPDDVVSLPPKTGMMIAMFIIHVQRLQAALSC